MDILSRTPRRTEVTFTLGVERGLPNMANDRRARLHRALDRMMDTHEIRQLLRTRDDEYSGENSDPESEGEAFGKGAAKGAIHEVAPMLGAGANLVESFEI